MVNSHWKSSQSLSAIGSLEKVLFSNETGDTRLQRTIFILIDRKEENKSVSIPSKENPVGTKEYYLIFKTTVLYLKY